MDDHLPALQEQLKAASGIIAIDPLVVVTSGASVFPQELYNMIIDGVARNLRSLRAASLVNKAWNTHARKHLFARIVVRAIERYYGYTAPGVIRDPTADLPVITFKDAVATIPRCFDNILRTLVLRAAPLHVRLASTTAGVRLIKADICAHDVRSFLERFPKLNSLVIENAAWVDCPGPVQCDCMHTIDKRPYKTLAFRHVTHDRDTKEDVTFITQSASSIDNLVIENASHLETPDPAYKIGPLAAFTLGISPEAWHHSLLIPEFPSHTIVSLNISGMSYEDVEIVQSIIEDQARSLRDVSLRVRKFGEAHGTQWDELGLNMCTALQHMKVCVPVDFGGMIRIHARQAMISHTLAQLPSTVRTITIVFNLENGDFARSNCLLSGKRWTDLATACRELPDFTTLNIHVCRPPGTTPVPEKLRDGLNEDLNKIFSDPEDIQVSFKITYGVRTAWTIDFDLYEPDEFEEMFGELPESTNETGTDLEDN